MTDGLRFLIAEGEPRAERDKRRASAGKSSGESYIATLQRFVPALDCDRITPADAGGERSQSIDIGGYDAVILTGSPLHLYETTPESQREVDFMRAVFASGVPSFGSCAGLQLATVAAGGSVRSMPRREAGFARRITPTSAGAAHPLLHGRPAAFDAIAVHGDEVEALPPGATCLASNAVSAVQAVEIRHGEGIFWGVQYHPELSLGEAAAALRRQADDLIAAGLARRRTDLNDYAVRIAALADEPSRVDLAWQLGIDAQVTEFDQRITELRNFVERLVRPTKARRGRR